MTAHFAPDVAKVVGVDPDCPVLLRRSTRPGTDVSSLPRYGDQRWTLTAALFEDHARATSINWAFTPAALVDAAKHVTWTLLNETVPAIRHSRAGTRLAVQTIASGEPNMRLFFLWLDDCGVTSLDQVTSDVLDDYLAAVRDSDATVDRKHDLLGAVRRVWACRELLPERHRLPLAPPWAGDDNGTLVGMAEVSAENLTPRIGDATMEPLLGWALLFVQELSKDILPAWQAHRALQRPSRRSPGQPRRPAGTVERIAREYAQRLTEQGLSMPGKRLPDGTLVPDLYYIARVLGLGRALLRDHAQAALAGVPVASNAYLVPGPAQGQIAGQPWRTEPIAYDEAKALARLLQTACFIVVAYLSGMRPGEALTLRRGCCALDPATGLWTISGKQWKGATDGDGNKAEEGKDRDLPWVVIEATADAVAVLESLHSSDLLFPTALGPAASGREARVGRARAHGETNSDLNDFLAWASEQHAATGLGAPVPTDPGGALSASRFRRTLAWFICRKPRGLVAGALQYGHLHTQVTLGYAGSADSGFKDEVSFERFLARADRLADDERRLSEGEHVSGPATEEYRRRVEGASAKFAGRVLTTKRQAAVLLGNPSLTIYEGEGMTCVYDRNKAACGAGPDSDDVRRTPDLTDCRPYCGNIARTDRDIAAVTEDADDLAGLADDPLCPEPLRHRYRHALSRHLAIVEVHNSTRPAASP